MKKLFQKLVLVAMIGLVSASLLQLSAVANEPECANLTCKSASDCGSKCFCNTPTEHCFED
jgi:hypothetical protein